MIISPPVPPFPPIYSIVFCLFCILSIQTKLEIRNKNKTKTIWRRMFANSAKRETFTTRATSTSMCSESSSISKYSTLYIYIFKKTIFDLVIHSNQQSIAMKRKKSTSCRTGWIFLLFDVLLSAIDFNLLSYENQWFQEMKSKDFNKKKKQKSKTHTSSKNSASLSEFSLSANSFS